VTHPAFRSRVRCNMGVPIGTVIPRRTRCVTRVPPLEGSGIGGRRSPPPWWRSGPSAFPAGVITDFATPAGGLTLARAGNRFALVRPPIAGKPGSIPDRSGPGVSQLCGRMPAGGLDFVVEAGWRATPALGGKARRRRRSGGRPIRSEGTTSEWLMRRRAARTHSRGRGKIRGWRVSGRSC